MFCSHIHIHVMICSDSKKVFVFFCFSNIFRIKRFADGINRSQVQRYVNNQKNNHLVLLFCLNGGLYFVRNEFMHFAMRLNFIYVLHTQYSYSIQLFSIFFDKMIPVEYKQVFTIDPSCVTCMCWWMHSTDSSVATRHLL